MEKENDKIYSQFIEICDSRIKLLDEITLNIIEFYYSKYRYIELELKNHIENKPSKIFKKRLKVWKDRKKELEKEKQLLLAKIASEIKELQK